MGNQEMKSAMSKIQDRSFDANVLAEFEAKLWREQSRDTLSGFDSHLNMDNKKWEDLQPFQSKLDIEKSGLDSDDKRYNDQAADCWQIGFTNHLKKVETLKHGGKLDKSEYLNDDCVTDYYSFEWMTVINLCFYRFYYRLQASRHSVELFGGQL